MRAGPSRRSVWEPVRAHDDCGLQTPRQVMADCGFRTLEAHENSAANGFSRGLHTGEAHQEGPGSPRRQRRHAAGYDLAHGPSHPGIRGVLVMARIMHIGGPRPPAL